VQKPSEFPSCKKEVCRKRAAEAKKNPISKQPLIRYMNRRQVSSRAVDVEHLSGEDHPARAIWALLARLNLPAFYPAIERSAEKGGGPAFAPRLLISLWVSPSQSNLVCTAGKAGPSGHNLIPRRENQKPHPSQKAGRMGRLDRVFQIATR
jgi:hypothetical protein